MTDGRASLSARPSPLGLVVSYALDYGGKYLPPQALEVKLTPEAFARDIAPARTYVLRGEIEEFRDRGLGGGATPENTIIVEEDGSTQAELRFANECVRHKVLDLVGDLQVIGGRLSAEIVARGSGHKLNAALAKEINRASARRED
jgi:UDP-3-O-acyl-N-acetylglucosamine deacetylase